MRGYTPEQAEKLTAISKAFGEVDYYQADDGMIYRD